MSGEAERLAQARERARLGGYIDNGSDVAVLLAQVDRLTAALKDAERELVLWRRGHAEQVKRADDAERERERLETIEGTARELAGYVRAHLAGQDADPELRWALEQTDEALQEPAPQGAEAGE